MAKIEKDDFNGAGRPEGADGASEDAQFGDQTGDINDNDIVFDCPHCGHGLVINYRGAGLIINCAECDMPVQVPIPDGMELADLDQEPEELQNQIRNLRRALFKSEEHGRELESVVNSLKERRTVLEKERVTQLHRLAEIRIAFEHVHRLHTEISATCSRVIEMIQTETR